MVVTVISAWFIGSQRPRRRMIAFWGGILSNVLWVVWGWHTNAFGLIVHECILLGMNARGFMKNQRGNQAIQITQENPSIS